MKEYRMAKGWRIFIYIAALLMIALFVFILLLPFLPGMNNGISSNAYWFFIPLSIAMIALMIVGILDTIKGKFVIDKNQVSTVSTFINRALLFSEIKGYRVTDKYLFIESNNESKKRIKVSTYVAHTNEIEAWLGENFKDLDVVESNEERKEILNNEEYGFTPGEREAKLAKARKAAKILNWSGGLLAVWTFVFPTPYKYAIIASIIFPVICIIVLKYYNGLIRINERKNTAYPSIFWALLTSTMALFIRILLDYAIFDYAKIWLPVIIITLVFIAFILVGNKEFQFKKANNYVTILGLLFYMSGYSYGALVAVNCLFDKSEPEIFNAKVLSKRVSTGKYTSYNLEITPWGPQKEVDEVQVSKPFYEQLETDDEVNIYFMKGKFNIAWYEVTD